MFRVPSIGSKAIQEEISIQSMSKSEIIFFLRPDKKNKLLYPDRTHIYYKTSMTSHNLSYPHPIVETQYIALRQNIYAFLPKPHKY